MCMEMTPWEKAVDFHGHVCPGLAMGYRAAMEAMERFKQERSEDEEIVAIVETDACGVDAVQVITGCTFGKGNFVYRDIGKQAFNFAVRGQDKGLRIVLKYDVISNLAPAEWAELCQKVFAGEANEDEQKKFKELHQQITNKILEEPLENIMDVKTMPIDIPSKARIHETVQCACCGEGVMKPRTVEKESGYHCLDCEN